MSRPPMRDRRRLAVLALTWVVVALAAPLLGSESVTPSALWRGDPTATTIFFQLRLPRVALSLVAGGILSISGVAFQTLFRNPLAEPYTLGVATGASLGAALAFSFWPGSQAAGLPVVAAASFAGAAIAIVVVLALGRGGRDGSGALLLAGVAVALFGQALILLLQYIGKAGETLRMVRWLMGGLSVVGYRELLWLTPWLVTGAVVIWRQRWELDLLLAGEEVAASRGVELAGLRRLLLAVTALMVGALVAVAGPIGFVGLMVPHMLRGWVGHRHAVLLPASLLGGGIFLASCDLAGRMLLAPAELPVGIVTAVLGGPFFLWVLGRRGDALP